MAQATKSENINIGIRSMMIAKYYIRTVTGALLVVLAAIGFGCRSHPEISIEFSPSAVDRLRVRIEAPATDDGMTRFTVETDWGGTIFDPVWTSGFQAFHNGQRVSIEVVDDGILLVRHRPGGEIAIEYDLIPGTSSYDDVGDYRPIVVGSGLAAFSALTLFLPEHVLDTESEIDVVFAGPPNTPVLSSFGIGTRRLVARLLPDRLRESMFVVGTVPTHIISLPRGNIAIAQLSEDALITTKSFASFVEPIITGTRDYFGETEESSYVVTFATAGEPVDNGFALGGTAVTNAFSFYFDPATTLGDDIGLEQIIAHLLCHEYVHNWNGVLFFVDEPDYEHQTRWFVEGFTDFLARRILHRSGIYDDETFTYSLNTRINEYDTQKHKSAGAFEAANAWQTDDEISNMIYQRGDLLAICIDQAVRDATNGAESLDDLMLELVRRAKAGDRRPTEKSIYTWITERAGGDFVDEVRRTVHDGGSVSLPDYLSEPPLQLVFREGRRMYVADDRASQ